MRIIGVTGGIGSGKSTVSRILTGFGAKIIDADVIAREVVQKGEKALSEIVDFFGTGILSKDGELDRKQLGKIVFNNTKKLEVLNSITHKYIIDKIIKEVNELKSAKCIKTVVVDAAIPFKHGFIDTVDEVWVVIAERDIRIKRIMERNLLTYEEAAARINSQMKDEEYMGIADRIITNNGDTKQLESLITELLSKENQGDAVE
ncbi:MAG: dephospho-CoA kinase [Clostridia bacterium]|nr:dephospho-CoA kinase [Clostridia bacterium]